jgi:amidase
MKRRDFCTSIAVGSAAAVSALRGASAAEPAGAAAKAARAPSGAPWSWSAVQLADAIRRGRISSRDATQSCLQRLHEVNPRINAIAEVLGDEALATADAADRLRKRDRALPPLHGVPVTTKINVDLAGHPTTNGVVAFKDAVAKEDSASVANLRKAGAVIIGRSNTPAFSFRWFSDNELHGATRNPFDPALTPGGSSGGASAAVAAGIGAIAHGNDIAGSVRYPAYACGVAGIRPSLGTVAGFNPSGAANRRTITSQLMAVQGLLARSVADLRLSLPALAARDVRDSWWQPMPTPPQRARKGVRVALLSELEGYTADREVAAGLASAANALRDAGYLVEQAAPPHFREIAELWSPLVMAESRLAFASAIEKFGDAKVKKAMATWLEITPDLDLRAFSAAIGRRDQILREWRLFFEKYPLLVTPSSWVKPFPVDYDQQGRETFRSILHAQSPMLAIALLGLPGLAVPTGIVGGVPTGVQVVADRFREDLCFDAGEAIEATLGTFTPIDPRAERTP